MRRGGVAVLVLLLLGSCSAEERERPGSATGTSPSAPPSATPEPSTTAAATPFPPSPPASPAGSPAVLLLQPGGIDTLSFGAPATDVVAALTARLGPPKSVNAAARCDSGANRTVSWSGLLAVFQDGKWTGYLWDGKGASVPAVTDMGIRVGSTVAQLRAAYPGVQIQETTLGDEWFAEVGAVGIGGFAAGADDADKVEAIDSGDICAFR